MNTQKFLSKTSPFVTEHIISLLLPFPHNLSKGNHTLHPTTSSQSTREQQLFWKYHSLFPQEFTKAILSTLYNNYHFISYDHLSNNLLIEVK